MIGESQPPFIYLFKEKEIDCFEKLLSTDCDLITVASERTCLQAKTLLEWFATLNTQVNMAFSRPASVEKVGVLSVVFLLD